KCSSVLIGGGLILLLGWRVPWLFRVAAVVLAVAEIEEIAITLTLRAWRADVPSIVPAMRLRRR
ncbi:MAG TPA: CDP-alcohol phosphatidyltransferase, partial [Candidatus Kryptonia bacterium]|nr:CDP-alcohol phosphatidyltransferase [Candidatus Kryptonia bacterium]